MFLPHQVIEKMTLSIRALTGTIVFFSLLIWVAQFSGAQDADNWQKESAAANSSAEKALAELIQIFTSLDQSSFSNEPITGAIRLGGTEILQGTPKIDALRQQIQFLIAQIDLAQDYPETKLKGEETIDEILKGRDFFGTSASQDFDGFMAKLSLIEKLFEDKELQFGNRLFGLIRTGKEPSDVAAAKWIKYIDRVAGPFYLGVTFDRQPTTLGRSLKALSILRGLTQSSVFQQELTEDSDLKHDFKEAMEKRLRPAVTNFARERYEKGGMLRDWCLPVVAAGERLFPDLTRDNVGVTTLANYQKTALGHARAVTQLVERIDDSVPSPKETNRALKAIRYYRDQSFYIGAAEVRENGTLNVPAHQEIDVILANAKFFAPDGNHNIKTYQKRTEHLDAMFLGEGSADNLELLISLKSKDGWVDFFDERLLGGKGKSESGVFPFIEKHHQITIDHLKILFLARTVLPSDSFERLFEIGSVSWKGYEKLKSDFGVQVREVSSLQFRNYPKEWINVQNGFQEIAKGFEDFDFEKLKVTTSTDLAMVRKDFEEGLYGSESVSEDFASLLQPETQNLIPSMDHMTSPELSKRIGKFDKQLTPEFVNRVNAKLADILEYRSYGLAAIDSLERPDLQAGRIMTHFAVSDYRIPGEAKTNTVIHDLICGPEGGFGGLGVLFRADAKGYTERESVFDAVETCDELILGEVLFKLALDINRNNESTDEDAARAARRWIEYFRKSQANAQFHAVPEVLNQAIRGTFLSRIVFKSESFQKALENSRSAPVGSSLDISYDLESALSAQVRKMQSMLAKIDPETATNRNINETAEKWQDLKVWYRESNKWLESLIADSTIIGEVSRVRSLQRKVANYQELCPEVVVFTKALEHYSGEIYNGPAPPTLGFAKFAIEQINELEPELNMAQPEQSEGDNVDPDKIRQIEFGRAVSNQFLSEIRKIVAEAGFEELSKVSNSLKIGAIYNSVLPQEAMLNTANSEHMKNRAKAMEEAFSAAAARAISRVEVDQPSDFRTLEEQAIRAAKVDRTLVDAELAEYHIDIEPSLLLNEWINHDRVEIMANFRSLELRAEARQLINKAKEERRAMIEVQDELQAIKAQSLQKMELLQDWIDKGDKGVNVEVVLEEVISIRQENAALKKEVSNLKDSESLMRARAADFAQKLFQYKRAGGKELEIEPTDFEALTLAEMANTIANPPPSSRPKPSATSRSRSRSSNSGSFFQRLFGRH
jgi:hypothetical protein